MSIEIARSLAAGLAAVLFAVSAQAQVTLRDDRGVTVTLPILPRRIVSLVPSLTESMCVLGGCMWLVGVDRFSNWPASVQSLPKLGGLDDAQIERIVALEPDVVLAAPAARVIDRLEVLGMKVVVLESRDHADVRRSLNVLAQLLGTPAEADKVWASIARDLGAAAVRVPPRLRGQRVYFEVDATPYAASASSFIGQTLSALGLANAVAPELGPFPRLNPEYVVRAQPDIVMGSQRNLDDMPHRPGWAALKALQHHRTCGFDDTHYELLVRPGPRMGEAARVLADCLVALARTGS